MPGMRNRVREPDERLDVPGASCGLWWSGVPAVAGAPAGAIGDIVAASGECLRGLFEHACIRLAAEGCAVALGPMDGSTWGRYRAVVERGTQPAFFLEPDEPDHVAGAFRAAGFGVAATYVSALETPISPDRALIADQERRAAEQGIRIRGIRLDRFEEELRRLHPLCIASFQSSFLFTPIGEEDFVALNRPLRDFIQPELFLLAEDDRRLVAMIFALPDALEAARGKAPASLIVKTMAALPEMRGGGLAHMMGRRLAESGRRSGYRRAIHALMHEANGSAAWSARYGRPFRRYALFSRRLGCVSKPPVSDR